MKKRQKIKIEIPVEISKDFGNNHKCQLTIRLDENTKIIHEINGYGTTMKGARNNFNVQFARLFL